MLLGVVWLVGMGRGVVVRGIGREGVGSALRIAGKKKAGGVERLVWLTDNDQGRASTHRVRDVGCRQDDEEGDKVGGRREGLRRQGVVAHCAEDGGQEDGQGGVGHVGEEEDGGR